MILKLKRTEYRDDGIFGILTDDDTGKVLAHTLEHSYNKQPKLNTGEHKCVRGIHQLHDLRPFETFEILGVPGHSGILFHVGNFNDDSDGCVLLGGAPTTSAKGQMLPLSRITFGRFMEKLNGIQEFTLVVES